MKKTAIPAKYLPLIATGLVILGILMRVVPHPANFAPITAIALFSGAVLPRRWGLWLPLVAVIISDFFIGWHGTMAFTWAAFGLSTLIGYGLIKQLSLARVWGASLAGSWLFFVISNFGVWAEGLLYPRTLDGLAQAYIMAIPFFRNTILGDLFYTSALFGVYGVAVYLARRPATSPQATRS
jgi:hypothetical protein